MYIVSWFLCEYSMHIVFREIAKFSLRKERSKETL